jgi:hypothetical protein
MGWLQTLIDKKAAHNKSIAARFHSLYGWSLATTRDTRMLPRDANTIGSAQPLAVTIFDAVRLSGLSRSEIYRRLSSGDIQARKSGCRTLIVWDSLKAHIEALPAAEFRTPRPKGGDDE